VCGPVVGWLAYAHLSDAAKAHFHLCCVAGQIQSRFYPRGPEAALLLSQPHQCIVVHIAEITAVAQSGTCQLAGVCDPCAALLWTAGRRAQQVQPRRWCLLPAACALVVVLWRVPAWQGAWGAEVFGVKLQGFQVQGFQAGGRGCLGKYHGMCVCCPVLMSLGLVYRVSPGWERCALMHRYFRCGKG
jgi:hypothetical protein